METPLNPTYRPGWKTTEWYLALAVAVMGGLATAFADKEWAKVAGVLAAALASVGYGMSRAATKGNL